MIIEKLDKYNYIVKITNNKLKEIDIFSKDEIEQFVKELFSKFIKKYNLKGEVQLDVHINNNYGMIIEININDYFSFDDLIDVRLVFHLNDIFLYEIDFFDILKNTNIRDKNIYFYKDKFYLELLSDIEKKDYSYLLESYSILYNNNTQEIINKGIKLII